MAWTYSFKAFAFVHTNAVNLASEVTTTVRQHRVDFFRQQDLSIVHFTKFINTRADSSIRRQIERVDLLIGPDRAFDCLPSMECKRDLDLVVASKLMLDSRMARISVEVTGSLQGADGLHCCDQHPISDLFASCFDFRLGHLIELLLDFVFIDESAIW